MNRKQLSLITFSLFFFLLNGSGILQAQNATSRKGSRGTSYEFNYDEPYRLKDLFIQIQPFYGEVFVTNVNVGFGAEVQYYLSDQFDFRANFRTTYGKSFDINRDAAVKVSKSVTHFGNVPRAFYYLEVGGTYHLRDQAYDGQSKIALYSKRLKGAKWAAHVPENIVVPSKVRKIIGARLGAFHYSTTVDLQRTMDDQNVWIASNQGESFPHEGNFEMFGNLQVNGIYIGGSMAWFRNFSVRPKNYSNLTKDLLLTTYFDVLVAPSVLLEDIVYLGNIYSTDPIKKNKLGFRMGIDGKFNQELSWSYGAEMGYRPSLKGQGTYVLIKASFPVLGFTFKKKEG
ncbi:hypothetical protein [Xanthovirga aplysinae]|uniref:hypothetical protein n=1 Tax=Xanthovirga aplysinae TaxID=2529853 RepID=UPI0012BD4CD9|nr:hypothetical protein [Xanthovirga aplysinae]MTI31548.1 hypothetical protein [Xanthovirga aplysinae]